MRDDEQEDEEDDAGKEEEENEEEEEANALWMKKERRKKRKSTRRQKRRKNNKKRHSFSERRLVFDKVGRIVSLQSSSVFFLSRDHGGLSLHPVGSSLDLSVPAPSLPASLPSSRCSEPPAFLRHLSPSVSPPQKNARPHLEGRLASEGPSTAPRHRPLAFSLFLEISVKSPARGSPPRRAFADAGSSLQPTAKKSRARAQRPRHRRQSGAPSTAAASSPANAAPTAAAQRVLQEEEKKKTNQRKAKLKKTKRTKRLREKKNKKTKKKR
ncbi:hypothetical protein TGP89_418560 [Toxoplasma gondii p89]|uniref:Uncharacterized protein n=1 Tax=Toxoplasma gondii p89 TaxID=943119 RepID=A0A086L2C5_TOXGO|nr:hypothetical protein TGP89_418560 [Toxoplasma gondii p89]